MAKPWRLTRAAEASLLEIAAWTFETFGARQAAAYEEDLVMRCHDIASGAALSQDCRRILDPNLPEDLRFTRAGEHIVVFVEDARQVIIIDILHARSDLPRRLAALTPPKAERDH
jgi:plasmid stabilization system protein ParE